MSGTLKDNTGAPVSDAIVTAYLQAKSTDGKFPPVFNSKTGNDGSFVLNALAAGTYLLCAEKEDIGLLNPCFWSGQPTSVTVSAGGTVTGISLVAEKGVALRIRLNDAPGLLAANDDVVIRAKPVIGPPLPTQIASKDAAGKTMTVLVPQAQPVDIHIYSAKLLLADEKGNAFTTPNVKVTVTSPSASASQNAAADLTLNIQGQNPKP